MQAACQTSKSVGTPCRQANHASNCRTCHTRIITAQGLYPSPGCSYSLLILAGTTLVRQHVTKFRCNSSNTLDLLPDFLCITKHTACMQGAAGCKHTALLQQKAAVSIVPVCLLTAVCGNALGAFLCLGLARSRPGSAADSNAY